MNTDKLTPDQIEEIKEKANALFDQRIEECAALFGVDSAFLIKAGLTSWEKGNGHSVAHFHYRGLNFVIGIDSIDVSKPIGSVDCDPPAIMRHNRRPLTLLFAMQRQINMIRRATDDDAKAAQIKRKD